MWGLKEVVYLSYFSIFHTIKVSQQMIIDLLGTMPKDFHLQVKGVFTYKTYTSNLHICSMYFNSYYQH